MAERTAEDVKRDPRVDPMPGDEIARDIKQAKDGTIIREIERAHGGFVGYFADNGYQKRWKIIPLTDWRKWAATAEVIHIAQPKEKTEQ